MSIKGVLRTPPPPPVMHTEGWGHNDDNDNTCMAPNRLSRPQISVKAITQKPVFCPSTISTCNQKRKRTSPRSYLHVCDMPSVRKGMYQVRFALHNRHQLVLFHTTVLRQTPRTDLILLQLKSVMEDAPHRTALDMFERSKASMHTFFPPPSIFLTFDKSSETRG